MHTQLNVGMFLAMFSTMLVIGCRPYNERRDNVISISIGLILTLFFVASTFFKYRKVLDDEDYDSKGLKILLISSYKTIIVVFLAWTWHKKYDFWGSTTGMALKTLGSNTSKASEKGGDIERKDVEINMAEIYGRRAPDTERKRAEYSNPMHRKALGDRKLTST